MVFADLVFLYLFLPLNLLVYYACGSRRLRNGVLVCFSLFFYAWGEPVWVFLLMFSAMVDFLCAQAMEQWRGRAGARAALGCSLGINLGLLAVFKYSRFVVENLNAWLGVAIPVPALALPLGISFYTFQTVSYSLDVYAGRVQAQRSYGKYLLYLSSYHQLVAGPIVRYQQVAQQIDHRRESLGLASRGMNRFLVGLCKKVLVANVAGGLGSTFLDRAPGELSVAGAWLGALLYTVQIYYDFSGYSDMAIGLGRMFGFCYRENFRHPYMSRSISEFWRRWHISLGSFFRDYVYIPLGGNRRRLYRNLLITWLATGLWHGASWNFVLWGLYYGVLIAAERAFLGRWLARLPGFVCWGYTFALVVGGWVLFYFTDLGAAGAYLAVMLGMAGRPLLDLRTELTVVNNLFWLVGAAVFCAPVGGMVACRLRHSRWGRRCLCWVRRARPVGNAAVLLLCTALLVGDSYNPFLYFRF